MAPDPFPRDRVAATLRRLPAYLRLTWRLARDPLLGRVRRAAVVAAAGYLASPIDLVPGVIPVAGQLDDLAVALGAIKFALAGLDEERRRAHLDAVGLGDDDVTTDLRTVAATSAWLVRAGARMTARATVVGGRLTVRGAKAAGRIARAAAPVVRQAAGTVPATGRGMARVARRVGTARAGARPADERLDIEADVIEPTPNEEPPGTA